MNKPITFFVGENGSGKSTLLEAIAVAYGFNAEGGTKNYSFSTYNSHSELCEAMTISKGYRRPKFGYFLRAESFYNVATKEIDYSDDDHPSKGYHQKSHGESFLAIAQDYMDADIQRNHTFTLSDDEGTIKTEQIQPLWGTVKVSGDCDTDVVFTDVETGEKYKIGYITQGVTERIKLERGKWYKVVGRGNLTLNPVNIRVE